MTFAHNENGDTEPNIEYPEYLIIDAYYLASVNNAITPKPTSSKELIIIGAIKSMYWSGLNKHGG